MAVEKYAGPNGNNKIIVTGENPYGSYPPMFSPTYKDQPFDGPKLLASQTEYESDKVANDIAGNTNLISQLQSTVNTMRSDIDGLRILLYVSIVVAIIGVLVGAVGMVRKTKA